jgi:hypothetical protein
MASEKINNIIVISDTHIGCQFGLCNPDIRMPLDGGGFYKPSDNQVKVWKIWKIFWEEWVPMVTKKEPYILVHNGDAIDGNHHKNTTQITHNITDQIKIAEVILSPVIRNSAGYYHIRGTEAHVGKSAQDEEMLAKQLNAIRDDYGNYSRDEMWLKLGEELIHFSHHIGITSSASYESTAVHKELVEAYNEAGRWGEQSPDCIVRSHRHRAYEIRIPSENGMAIAFVTPGWQLKTPFVHRMVSGRVSTPQIGGYIIRRGDEDGLYTRLFVKKIKRPKEVIYE